MAELSRNEGYVAVNRLTGAYLDENVDRRALKSTVKKFVQAGTWVDIVFHANGGARHKVEGFMVEGRKR